MTRPSSITLKKFQSFDVEGAQLEGISRVNILLGPNNVGKSKILRAVERCLAPKEGKRYSIDYANQYYEIEVKRVINEKDLQRYFQRGVSGGIIPFGEHWESFGKNLLNTEVTIQLNKNKRETIEVIPKWDEKVSTRGYNVENIATKYFNQDNNGKISSFGFDHSNSIFVLSERDIKKEPASLDSEIQPDGSGATNIIRRYFTATGFDREILENIVNDLNKIVSPDYYFEEISARQIEDEDVWEIYLKEKGAGFVALSQCGSGLKTIIIILAQFHIGKIINNKEETLLLFEELENSLHPKTQRRLLNYIDNMANESSTIFISTHSPVALDLFQGKGNVSFFEVYKNDSNSTSVRKVQGFLDKAGVLDALDVRASEAMQTNFGIWVEGPSDRIYLRKWIDLLSNGVLKEKEHYVIMFYGGKLLSHLTLDENNHVYELINLLRINKNCALLIDSDRSSPKSRINLTKKRISSEARSYAKIVWTTQGREIENYISGAFWSSNFNVTVAETDQFERIFEKLKGKKTSEGRIINTKMDIAKFVDLHAGEDDFRLNWKNKTKEIIRAIMKSNGME
ncbi:MAG: ATP-binding protein [Maricaulaceae bacterium]|nr:ATP-binding protein [Maricaulaceae bacterium]